MIHCNIEVVTPIKLLIFTSFTLTELKYFVAPHDKLQSSRS